MPIRPKPGFRQRWLMHEHEQHVLEQLHVQLELEQLKQMQLGPQLLSF